LIIFHHLAVRIAPGISEKKCTFVADKIFSIMNNLLVLQQYLRDNQIFSQYNLTRIGVFGSFARDEANAGDIDILIEDDIDPDNLIQLKSLLETGFQKKVDVVLRKFANPIILYRAQKDLLYATRY
jgi:predicted nucleotidyltransferase